MIAPYLLVSCSLANKITLNHLNNNSPFFESVNFNSSSRALMISTVIFSAALSIKCCKKIYFYGVIYYWNDAAFAGTAPAEVMNASANAIASVMA